MTREQLQALIEKRNGVAAQMQAMLNTAEDEDRGFSSDEKEKWDKMGDDVVALDSRIDAGRRALEIGEAVDVVDYNAVNSLPNPGDGQRGNDTPHDGDPTYESAFRSMFRSTEFGLQGLDRREQDLIRERRAQAVGTDSAGGYVVPEGFGGQIIETMQAFGGVMNRATVIRTATGNRLPFPTVDDTSNTGALIAENAADSEQDVTFGEVELGAYRYTSRIIRVSWELMQDSAFDLEAFIARQFGIRLGRITSAHLATGTGTAQPNGIVTAASSGFTAAAAAAIVYADLLGLEHSVDPAYRAMGAAWIMNDDTLKLIKSLVDGDGRPLWFPGLAGLESAAPSNLMGYEYEIDQGFANAATTTTPIVFGHIEGYAVRLVQDFTLQRFMEKYADNGQTGFSAHVRMDGELLDTDSVKKLTMA